MTVNLDFFANERYELLKILSESQVRVGEDLYINLSQEEIAAIAKMAKMKANKIINELINADCLDLYKGKRGKYVITEKGTKVLKLMQKKIN